MGGPWEDYADTDAATLSPGGEGFPASSPDAPVTAPPAKPGAAPAGPWSDYADPNAPAAITDTGTTMGFADEAPAEASKQLSPEDTATFYRMLRGDGVPKADAEALRQFMASKGMSLQNADEIVAARDKGLGVNGSISYPLPKPADPSSMTGAALRGAGQGATLGFGDELHGAYEGAKAALTGGSFGDAYDSTVDADRGRMAADEEQHPVASIAGELLGGFALPVGLEKAGLTAAIETVGLRAGRTALREGATMDEARAIAARAITRRLATEGGAYGAAYGAGKSDGDPAERLEAAGAGAVEGAGLGAVLGKVGEAVSPRFTAARVAAREVPVTDAQSIALAAQRQGVDILPQDVAGEGIGRATAGAAQTTFGAPIVRRAADRMHDSFARRADELAGDAPSVIDAGNIVGERAGQAASRATTAAERTSGAVADALGPSVDATAAGQLAQRGVSRFLDDTAETASRLYDAVPIAADQPAQVDATRRTLSDMTAEWASNPKLSAIFRSGRLAGYLKALTPESVVQEGRLLPGGGRAQSTTGEVGGALNWQDLSEFRTRVGDMLADPNLTEKIAPRQLRALYGALSQDMEATAKASGTEAFARWKRANDYYDGRMKRVNDTLSMIVGDRNDRTPNEAFAALQSMLRDGSTGNAAAFARVMRSIPPEDARTIRSTIVAGQRGGRQFDPDQFATAWGQLSERGKSALLPETGMRTLMDDAASRAAADARNPFAGLSGEQIFAKLQTMATNKGDANRLRGTIAHLSPGEAATVRAAYMNQLGRAAPGAQNAQGDAFSIATWLTNWNRMSDEAKAALFGGGVLRDNMNDLAKLAEQVKASARLAGHSNTGAVNSFNATTGGLWGAVSSLIAGTAAGHPLLGAGGAVLGAAPAVYQRLSAEMLTSPRLLRWLVKTPRKPNIAAEREHLASLSKIAVSEPAIFHNVIQLQARLSDLMQPSVATRLAAQEGPQVRQREEQHREDEQPAQPAAPPALVPAQ